MSLWRGCAWQTAAAGGQATPQRPCPADWGWLSDEQATSLGGAGKDRWHSKDEKRSDGSVNTQQWQKVRGGGCGGLSQLCSFQAWLNLQRPGARLRAAGSTGAREPRLKHMLVSCESPATHPDDTMRAQQARQLQQHGAWPAACADSRRLVQAGVQGAAGKAPSDTVLTSGFVICVPASGAGAAPEMPWFLSSPARGAGGHVQAGGLRRSTSQRPTLGGSDPAQPTVTTCPPAPHQASTTLEPSCASEPSAGRCGFLD